MNKLIVSVLTAASLVASGAAWAQGGDAESQAGSAWRGPQNYGPYAVPQAAPGAPRADSSDGFGPAPGTQEYYGNSGWTPPGHVYGGTDRFGRPIYHAIPPAAAIHPRGVHPEQIARDQRARERERIRDRDADRTRINRDRNQDRDGDGVRNNRDRYPDDGRRW
jgi:hypothetical protein